MSRSQQYRNKLLAGLSTADVARLQPDLTYVPLVLHQVLYEPGATIKQVYFLESGMASLIGNADQNSIEIGIIRRDGLAGIPVVLGARSAPQRCFVQGAGEAQRIGSGDLRRAMDGSMSLRSLLLRYAHAFMVQIAQTAVCNTRHEVHERLARWMLMAHDRADGDSIEFTHEFLSLMLGVRRAGITEAIGPLQKAGIVRQGQGRIRVLSRAGLEAASCSCYAIAKSESDRLLH